MSDKNVSIPREESMFKRVKVKDLILSPEEYKTVMLHIKRGDPVRSLEGLIQHRHENYCARSHSMVRALKALIERKRDQSRL